MATVTFSDVGKTYPDGTRAVIDLNLEIGDGEFVVFVGPSGCGKTTALRMVAGLEEITDGELRIGERVVNEAAPPADGPAIEAGVRRRRTRRRRSARGTGSSRASR